MTGDKGPDNKQEEENSWMCCTDQAPVKERRERLACGFNEPQPQKEDLRAECLTLNHDTDCKYIK